MISTEGRDQQPPRRERTQGPRTLDALTEFPRTLLEVTSLSLLWLPLLQEAPKGEPHPVMVLPGFMGGDDSTLMLRRFLARLRYKPEPWLQGRNSGNPKQLEAALLRFYRLHHSMGTKVSLIGQSLGGVYAREIAKEFPDAVRCVITLGSPYGATNSGTTNAMVERMFEQMSGLTVEEMRAQMPADRDLTGLPMPTTSVYSKEDGVVAWHTCIEPETDRSENIRVMGSHVGMAMNPSILSIVADRLAQDPDNWTKFDTQKGCRRFTYPNC